MSNVYRFDDSKAQIKESKTGFYAKCQCGWKSEPRPSKEEVIIAFENHVRSNPRHKIKIEEKKGADIFTLLIAGIAIAYILSPYDFVPDSLVLVGWIEDILLAVFAAIFIKRGFEGKSPSDIFSEIF